MKKICLIILFSLLPYLFLKTIFPTKPVLNNPVQLCKTENIFGWELIKESNYIIARCKDSISTNTLYHADFIKVSLTTNKKFKMRARLQHKGYGRDVMSTESLEVHPMQEGTSIQLNYILDRPEAPKIDMLSNDVDEIFLEITDFTDIKDFILNINSVILI